MCPILPYFLLIKPTAIILIFINADVSLQLCKIVNGPSQNEKHHIMKLKCTLYSIIPVIYALSAWKYKRHDFSYTYMFMAFLPFKHSCHKLDIQYTPSSLGERHKEFPKGLFMGTLSPGFSFLADMLLQYCLSSGQLFIDFHCWVHFFTYNHGWNSQYGLGERISHFH